MLKENIQAGHYSFATERIAPSDPLQKYSSDDKPTSEKPDWASQPLNAFATVERTVRLTLGLFADTRLPAKPGQEAIRELLSTFPEFERLIESLETEIAHGFPENRRLVVSKAKISGLPTNPRSATPPY